MLIALSKMFYNRNSAPYIFLANFINLALKSYL
jgi:hypothetical protein